MPASRSNVPTLRIRRSRVNLQLKNIHIVTRYSRSLLSAVLHRNVLARLIKITALSSLDDMNTGYVTFADSIMAFAIEAAVAPGAFAAAKITASRRTISAAAAGTSLATS